MIQAFVITVREGIEAFLIVAISLSYLKKTGRADLVSPVYWGIAVSLITSGIAGYLFSLASNQSLWEGLLAVIATVLVASLVVHMMRVARTLKVRIQGRLERATESSSTRAAWLGVFFFIVLMVTREGMETALLLGTLLFQMKAFQVFMGALAGVLAAASIAFLWSCYGHRVNLRRFLQVTAIFLLVFVVQLLIYGVHELAEAGFLPNSVTIHDATEVYGPDGIYGRWLSFGLVAIPFGWLLISSLADRFSRARASLRERFATK
jgi:high-affinity iron transporter